MASPATPPDEPRLFKTPAAWAKWLQRNHASAPEGVWMKIAKKGSGERSVTYPEALDEALCWGWIDGLKKSLDDRFFLQRWSPRRKRSIWSKINTEKATALIAAGRMREPGLAEVQRAKADGRWDSAYLVGNRAPVPPDLQAAIDASPRAAAFFATLGSQNRFAFIGRLYTLKTPEARARRIARHVAMMERGETFYPVKRLPVSGSGRP